MITKKQIKRLLHFSSTQIRKNKQTNKYYWACYGDAPINKKSYFASDGEEYKTRDKAIKAFLNWAIGLE